MMDYTKEKVLAALSTVQEPDLKKDLVTLNMIKDVEINGNTISFTVVLTTPACPLKELIKNDCTKAVLATYPAAEVVINMTADVTSIMGRLTPDLPEVRNIIAISSGKGGVGKSTVAANLAVALARLGATVGLLDADIYGPSVPIMFGAEDDKPAILKEDDKTKIIPITKYGVKLISIGFLTSEDSAVIWRGPMASSALRQFIGDCKWGALDYLLIDLPPGTSDIHLSLVQSVALTGAVVVSTPQKVALADAKKGISMFNQAQINVPILGIVENMAYFTPKELPENKYYIFGQNGARKLAAEKDIPFLGEVPIEQSIREAGDSGNPIALEDSAAGLAFSELAKELARQVALRNASQAKTEKTEVTHF
jgi:ATP-binding protein involved in chromosome partitioning